MNSLKKSIFIPNEKKKFPLACRSHFSIQFDYIFIIENENISKPIEASFSRIKIACLVPYNKLGIIGCLSFHKPHQNSTNKKISNLSERPRKRERVCAKKMSRNVAASDKHFHINLRENLA